MTLTAERREPAVQPSPGSRPARTAGGTHRMLTGGLLVAGLAAALGVLAVVAAASGQLSIPAPEVASGFLRGLGIDL
ncbi:iron ABC transporter permease, partial [Dietzia natronolimnaea]|nr:iron ABC transporter permease [Dietzia natronolimnaea]